MGLPPYRPTPTLRWYARIAGWIDARIGWSQLSPYLGVLTLGGLRITLRRRNLVDTNTLPTIPQPAPITKGDRYLTARMSDGTFNDLTLPVMGSAGTRFGRNVPLSATTRETERSILTPNPRVVSRELLTRNDFIPAKILNLHAAAWLQFMVHDWLSHGQNLNPSQAKPWQIPLADDDPWDFQRPMQILRTRPDPTRPPGSGSSPTHVNTETHWWDASQLYGSSSEIEATVRSGSQGKLRIEDNGLLPVDPASGIEVTGVNGNWWLGLDLMHTLFTREHNAICDRLVRAYPSWTDQELFDCARLVLAALLAKIHTIEWTPAILANPTLKIGLRANWYGVAEERIHRLLGRISKSEFISGIPGSETDHFGIPYSITEDFVAVYRMHPLLPDEFQFRSIRGNRPLAEHTLQELTFSNAHKVLEEVSMGELLYSFGTAYPGAVQLHNYPRSMQQLKEPDGTVVDLAATDILRNRERGVPRYNRFRQLLHKAPVRRFEDLSDNPDLVEEIRAVYGGDLDSVDLITGLYAEPVPKGFGFSDTAFRIFILMASRRLNSDRFLTRDFTPEVYTPEGMKWIEDNGFASVLLRHFPMLRPALRGVDNPFAPWPLQT